MLESNKYDADLFQDCTNYGFLLSFAFVAALSSPTPPAFVLILVCNRCRMLVQGVSGWGSNILQNAATYCNAHKVISWLKSLFDIIFFKSAILSINILF